MMKLFAFTLATVIAPSIEETVEEPAQSIVDYRAAQAARYAARSAVAAPPAPATPIPVITSPVASDPADLSVDDELIANHQARLEEESADEDVAEIERAFQAAEDEPSEEDLLAIMAAQEGFMTNDEAELASWPAARAEDGSRLGEEPSADDLLAIEAAQRDFVAEISAAANHGERINAADLRAVQGAIAADRRGAPVGVMTRVQRMLFDIVRRNPLATQFIGSYLAFCLLGFTSLSLTGLAQFSASLVTALLVARGLRDPQSYQRDARNVLARINSARISTVQDIRRRLRLN